MEKRSVGRPRKHYSHVGVTSKCFRPPVERVSVIPSCNVKKEGDRILVSKNVVKIKATNNVSKKGEK